MQDGGNVLARWTNILSRLIKANQINLLSGLFDHNSGVQGSCAGCYFRGLFLLMSVEDAAISDIL